MEDKKQVINEIGTICLYVSAFGFCDYIVEYFHLKKYRYLIFYLLILLSGVSILFLNNKYHHKNR